MSDMLDYEIHITLRPPSDKYAELQYRARAQEFGWKFSKIDGDPVLGDAVWHYLTTHRHSKADALTALKHMAAHFPGLVVREKIELIVYDTRY